MPELKEGYHFFLGKGTGHYELAVKDLENQINEALEDFDIDLLGSGGLGNDETERDAHLCYQVLVLKKK